MDSESEAGAPLVLLVEDDRELSALLGEFLGRHGFRVAAAGSGAEMDRLLEAERPDAIVLDLMLPGEDGLAICRRLAARDGPPVIMLSALGEETDRVVGLELGADDYLPKPCSPRELLARIRAVLRRSSRRAPADGEVSYRFAGWRLEPIRRELHPPSGPAVPLSAGEFQLLKALLDRPLRILSRDQLLDLVKGSDADLFDRAVDVQVSRLRKKLGDAGDLIQTVRSEGYRFAVRPVVR